MKKYHEVPITGGAPTTRRELMKLFLGAMATSLACNKRALSNKNTGFSTDSGMASDDSESSVSDIDSSDFSVESDSGTGGETISDITDRGTANESSNETGGQTSGSETGGETTGDMTGTNNTDSGTDTETNSNSDSDSDSNSGMNCGTEALPPPNVGFVQFTNKCLAGGNAYPLTLLNVTNATSYSIKVKVNGSGTPGSVEPSSGLISGDGDVELSYISGNTPDDLIDIIFTLNGCGGETEFTLGFKLWPPQ